MKLIKNKQAQSILEYTIVVALVIGVFLAMGRYITRSMSGKWQEVGDSFGYGQQYDPNLTLECKYDYVYTNSWYNAECFRQNCDCSLVTGTNVTCQTCITVDCAVAGRCDGNELPALQFP